MSELARADDPCENDLKRSNCISETLHASKHEILSIACFFCRVLDWPELECQEAEERPIHTAEHVQDLLLPKLQVHEDCGDEQA